VGSSSTTSTVRPCLSGGAAAADDAPSVAAADAVIGAVGLTAAIWVVIVPLLGHR
jgi:hypothetical protein